MDPDGKIILPFVSAFTMNTGSWSETNLTGTTEDKYKIMNAGCAVTAGANFTATVSLSDSKFTVLNPGEVNSKYCSDGIMNWATLADAYDFSATRGYGELSNDQISEMLNDPSNEYVILLDVNYKNETSPHWVGYDGLDANQFGNPSFRIGKSSDNDDKVIVNTAMNKRQQRGWTDRWDCNILVPRNQVKGYVIFKRSIEAE